MTAATQVIDRDPIPTALEGNVAAGQTVFVDGGPTLFADVREPWSSE